MKNLIGSTPFPPWSNYLVIMLFFIEHSLDKTIRPLDQYTEKDKVQMI